MQENRFAEEIIDGVRQIRLKNKKRTVLLHPPGTVVTLEKSGRRYEVQPSGAWKRIRDEKVAK